MKWELVSVEKDEDLDPQIKAAFDLLQWADRASRGNCTQCGRCPLGEHKEEG